MVCARFSRGSPVVECTAGRQPWSVRHSSVRCFVSFGAGTASRSPLSVSIPYHSPIASPSSHLFTSLSFICHHPSHPVIYLIFHFTIFLFRLARFIVISRHHRSHPFSSFLSSPPLICHRRSLHHCRHLHHNLICIFRSRSQLQPALRRLLAPRSQPAFAGCSLSCSPSVLRPLRDVLSRGPPSRRCRSRPAGHADAMGDDAGPRRF